MEPYEAPSPKNYYAADDYEELAEKFVAFIKSRKPRLAPLAEKLVKEASSRRHPKNWASRPAPPSARRKAAGTPDGIP